YIGMRLPIAVCYGLTVLGLYLLAGKYYARTGAVLTVLCYMAIPRVFGHAHIAATETIVCMLLVWMTYCFVKGLDSPWAAVLCGVCWGLALATKINAMFFPVPLLIWAHLFQRRRYANNVFALAFVAPFVMVAVWPWLWPEPFVRLVSYLKFFAGHKDISVFYFGQRYPLFDGTRVVRTPASYPFLMTVFTTPVLTLGLALLGLARTVANLRRHDIGVLYLLQALTPLFLAALPISPRYDGVRLFVPVFPFLALLAGVGGEGLAASLRGFRPFEQWPGAPRLFAQGLSVFIAAQGIVTISRCHPHELSHWNSLLGGFSGAYKARMETTYWGEAVNEDVYDYLQKLPDGTRVRPLALNDVCFRLLQEWDVIPRGLKIDTHPPSDVIVMQMREGFLGDEEQYLLSGILQIPCFALVQHDGIPFVVAFDLRGYPKAAAALMEFHDKIEAMRQAAEKAVRSAASASGGVQ
ncbi:MAG: glycosyltransferase family 39 protein, partial [Acidobacteria bacterium]|nr:glycosyltransferase family 39 protein [Acidobacteriota bacterium]